MSQYGIPCLLTVQKKKRLNPSKPVRVTQVCWSMQHQNTLEKVLLVQDENKERKRKEEKRGWERVMTRSFL